MEINKTNKVDPSALYDAAMRGDTETLQEMLRRDNLILKRLPLSSFTETPLHISVLAGHLDFTRALLRHDPGMAMEVDASNCTPLHLASAAGHCEIVGALLGGVGSDACLVRDVDGRIPLHLATMRGRSDVVRELVGARPESVLVKLDDGETVLHLCVKCGHLEALKVLVEMMVSSGGKKDVIESIFRSGDGDGNTILHSAAMFKQVQTTSYLVSLPSVGAAVNSLNGFGSTALDCLELCPKDFKSLRIRDLLVEAGGKRAKEIMTSSTDHHHLPPPPPPKIPSLPISSSSPLATNMGRPATKSMGQRFKNFLDYDRKWIDDMKGSLLVVAGLMAQMSFQAATNPPGGVWQENVMSPDGGFGCQNTTSGLCRAGTSVHAYRDPEVLYVFMGLNTMAFGASLCVMLLIIGGFPLRKRFFIWMMAQAMCAALGCMTAAFAVGALLVTPTKDDARVRVAVVVAFLLGAWLLSSLVISLLDTLRFCIWISKKKKKKTGARASTCSVV
ncbi:unnamed protein product [Linum tenue]|uniref:PGG domain-containing protein n=1 Tax=Linum tenue TaxID=586396 RepID=A0AAV0JGG2_9ROSI|nr:unnamed protein product [Linum tenue]